MTVPSSSSWPSAPEGAAIGWGRAGEDGIERGPAEARLRRRLRTRVALFLLLAIVAVAVLGSVAWTLGAVQSIDVAESARDRWQRPSEVLQALGLAEGAVVADIGSGVGYFSLKLAERVGPRGSVLAIDQRRLPLLLVRVMALLQRRHNLTVVHADSADARLAAGALDAVLVANTYHELRDPRAVLAHARDALATGGRIVIVDPAPDEAPEGAPHEAAHHHETADAAAGQLRQAGFDVVARQDDFTRGPDGQRWWLVAGRKPVARANPSP